MLARLDRVMALAVLIGIAFVAALAIAVATGASDPFDEAVIRLVRSDALVGVLQPLRQITQLGATGTVTAIALLALVAGIIVRRPRLGAAASLTIVLASLGNSLLKLGFARTRPDLLDPIVVEHGFSFPSGHSVLSMVAYGVVGVVIWRAPIPSWVRWIADALLALVILAVGVSRVWLGVHYPTDVLAGWTVGGLVVLVFGLLSRGSTSPAGVAAAADRAGPRSDPPVQG
jgi:undecaprenyl-diphosphatase